MADNQITPFDFWDVQNPRSIVNIVPKSLADAIHEAYRLEPGLFGRDERDLKLFLRETNRSPSPTDNRLRLNFWLAYEQAQQQIKPISLLAISSGVCGPQLLVQHYLAHPHKMAWILTPVAGYETVVTEALQFSLERMRDILDMKEELPNGQINMKLLELKVKIHAMLDLRLKGLPTQKIEQKNMTFSMHHSSRDTSVAAEEQSIEYMERRIKDLEARKRKAQNLPDIQVESLPMADPGAGAPDAAVERSQPLDVAYKSV